MNCEPHFKPLPAELDDRSVVQKKFSVIPSGTLEAVEEDVEAFTFFDNGAVKNTEGDFVIKCDQVKEVA